MTTWERPVRHQQRRKTPSFSSSLLDAIYHSIDESEAKEEKRPQEKNNSLLHRRNNALEVEEEIASLRKAIMIEKWMENYTRGSRSRRHFNSDSSSSTDSSFFSSSETESASKSTPKSSVYHAVKAPQTLVSEKAMLYDNTPKHEGRFMRTKSRALQIYGDLKKVKQPISPGGKIANFLNSIFNSKNLKKHQGVEDWSSVRKSRSVKDSSTCSLTSRSCLNRPTSTRNKSKRSVRFCPVSVIVDEDCQPCGHKNINDNDPSTRPMPNISSHFIKKNIDSFRDYEEKYSNKYQVRGFYEDNDDGDGNSCTSSDLFELENIGIVGIGANREELPVYGTTNLKINQAIANGLVM